MAVTTSASSDLRIWVESPNGIKVELCFIAEGGEPATNPAGWYPTNFTPHEDMMQWHGEEATGAWTIICQDWSQGGGSSTLTNWQVELSYDEALPISNVSLGTVKAMFH